MCIHVSGLLWCLCLFRCLALARLPWSLISASLSNLISNGHWSLIAVFSTIFFFLPSFFYWSVDSSYYSYVLGPLLFSSMHWYFSWLCAALHYFNSLHMYIRCRVSKCRIAYQQSRSFSCSLLLLCICVSLSHGLLVSCSGFSSVDAFMHFM